MSDTPVVETVTYVMHPIDGYKSTEAASFVTQLDDLTKRVGEDLDGITPEELEWQASPGMNTIGMLLAHLAVVEVHWMNVGVLGLEFGLVNKTLPIPEDADGIPLADGASPPAGLSGKTFDWYRALEKTAREHTYATLKPVTDEGMSSEIERLGKGGDLRIRHNVRWVLYHVLEHYAGHYGQILMLRHMYRSSR